MTPPAYRWSAAAALALAALAIGSVIATRTTGVEDAAQGYRGSPAAVSSPLPDFALRDQDGRVVRSAELRGKVTLLTFLDTQCTEACPIIAAQVARTLDRLTPDERAHVAAIAISADPKEDTPASIRAFLRRNHAERQLRYLSAPQDTLRPVWQAAQILPSADTDDDDTHSAPVRIYGRDGRWIATQHVGADLSLDNLAHDIRLALSQERTARDVTPHQPPLI